MLGAFILVDIISIVTSYVKDEPNSTSYIAHGSGMVIVSKSTLLSHISTDLGVIMGLLVGLIILDNRRVQHWETWLRIASCVLAAILLLVFLILNIVLEHIVDIEDTNTECDEFLL